MTVDPAGRDAIARLPLLSDTTAADLDQLFDHLTIEHVEADAVVMREGEVGTRFALVVTGELAVERAGHGVIATAGSGSVVGELAMLRNEPRNATIRAATDATLAWGPKEGFACLVDLPGVRDHFVRIVSLRLAEDSEPVPITLKDGRVALVRPLVPADRAGVEAGLGLMSPESLRRRFFSGGMPNASVVDYLVHIDYVHHFAWVVVPPAPAPAGLAVARWIRGDGDDAHVAEVAFGVVDAFQGLGIATFLMGALAVAADAAGVTEFTADVLYDNRPMRAVFDKLAVHWEMDEPGVVHTVFPVRDALALIDPTIADQLARCATDIVSAAHLALL